MQVYDERFSVVRDNVVVVYEQALTSPLDDTAKLDLWARYLYFAENYDDNVGALVDLRRRFADFRRSRSFHRNNNIKTTFDRPSQAPDFWDDDNPDAFSLLLANNNNMDNNGQGRREEEPITMATAASTVLSS